MIHVYNKADYGSQGFIIKVISTTDCSLFIYGLYNLKLSLCLSAALLRGVGERVGTAPCIHSLSMRH